MSSTDRSKPAPDVARRNARIGLICAVAMAGMVGAAYASVPIYRAFCQLTGFDGTVRKAEAAPEAGQVLNKTVLVRFDTNVNGVPFEFEAEQVTQSLKIGETGLAFFKVTNTSGQPVTARAVYNVVPEQAGAYLRKLQCFCFDEQTIAPGKTVEFPMAYFIDPEYASDFETRNKGEITLSYTFFPAVEPAKAETRADASQAKLATGLGGRVQAGL